MSLCSPQTKLHLIICSSQQLLPKPGLYDVIFTELRDHGGRRSLTKHRYSSHPFIKEKSDNSQHVVVCDFVCEVAVCLHYHIVPQILHYIGLTWLWLLWFSFFPDKNSKIIDIYLISCHNCLWTTK